MIASLFTALTEALGGFADAFTSVVSDVVAIFWDATGGTLTVIGTLMVIGLAISVVYGVIRWISRLVRMRG